MTDWIDDTWSDEYVNPELNIIELYEKILNQIKTLHQLSYNDKITNELYDLYVDGLDTVDRLDNVIAYMTFDLRKHKSLFEPVLKDIINKKYIINHKSLLKPVLVELRNKYYTNSVSTRRIYQINLSRLVNIKSVILDATDYYNHIYYSIVDDQYKEYKYQFRTNWREIDTKYLKYSKEIDTVSNLLINDILHCLGEGFEAKLIFLNMQYGYVIPVIKISWF